MRLWVGILALLAATASARDGLAKKEKWVFRPAYTATHFRVKHLLISTVRGSFSQVEGEVYLDTDDMTQSSVSATVYIKSLATGDLRRDKRLKGLDFFNMGNYPWATFNSKHVEEDADGNLLVTGELTMHGISKEVTLEVEGPTPAVKDPDGIPARAISAHTRLDRKDFGMAWNHTLDGGGVEVGDEVIVEIDAELVPPPAAPPPPSPKPEAPAQQPHRSIEPTPPVKG